MIRTLAFLALVVPAGSPVPAAAPAEPVPLPCHAYTEIARQLGDRYREAQVAAGLQNDGTLLQVFASADGDTWTVLSTAPDGTSCVVAAGRGWQAEPPEKDPAA
ncbi:MAG: hypothetical protein U1E14_00610 [Geminicoccaceae bacterium]